MLTSLRIRGFRSIKEQEIHLALPRPQGGGDLVALGGRTSR